MLGLEGGGDSALISSEGAMGGRAFYICMSSLPTTHSL